MTRKKIPQEELLSISALAERFGLDRETVRKYLKDVAPVRSEKRLKLYRLQDAEQLLTATVDEDLESAKRRRAIADAALAELKLEEKQGELVSAREVRDELQQLFTRLHQKLAVQYPREISGQLYKAETAAQIAEILRNGTTKIFNDLRSDYKSLFGSPEKRNS
jgi:transcriptional regulator with XRE-family HTH domain